MLRGGIFMLLGKFLEMSSKQVVVGMIAVIGEIGRDCGSKC